MEIDKIKELLEYRFSLTTELPQKRHIIFWYDTKNEFKVYNEITDSGFLKHVIVRNNGKNNVCGKTDYLWRWEFQYLSFR